MGEVLFDKDPAACNLVRYKELRKYLLTKAGTNARDLHEELARQAAKTEISKQWWRDVTHKLSLSEDLHIERAKSGYYLRQHIVCGGQSDLNKEEQTLRVVGRTARRSLTANALLSEGSPGYAQRGRSNSSDGSRGD